MEYSAYPCFVGIVPAALSEVFKCCTCGQLTKPLVQRRPHELIHAMNRIFGDFKGMPHGQESLAFVKQVPS